MTTAVVSMTPRVFYFFIFNDFNQHTTGLSRVYEAVLFYLFICLFIYM